MKLLDFLEVSSAFCWRFIVLFLHHHLLVSFFSVFIVIFLDFHVACGAWLRWNSLLFPSKHFVVLLNLGYKALTIIFTLQEGSCKAFLSHHSFAHQHVFFSFALVQSCFKNSNLILKRPYISILFFNLALSLILSLLLNNLILLQSDIQFLSLLLPHLVLLGQFLNNFHTLLFLLLHLRYIRFQLNYSLLRLLLSVDIFHGSRFYFNLLFRFQIRYLLTQIFIHFNKFVYGIVCFFQISVFCHKLVFKLRTILLQSINLLLHVFYFFFKSSNNTFWVKVLLHELSFYILEFRYLDLLLCRVCGEVFAQHA